MQNLLYHSTPVIGIKSLSPLSHLGTFEAALENYGRKFIDINITARAEGRDYELEHEILVCRLKPISNSIGPIADWASPAPLGLLSALRHSFPEIISDDGFEEFKENCGSDKAYDEPATEMLIKLLSARNIQYVSYSNYLEDRDSISICVVDPSIIIIEKRLQFTLDQICSSVKGSIVYNCSEHRNFADELLALLKARI